MVYVSVKEQAEEIAENKNTATDTKQDTAKIASITKPDSSLTDSATNTTAAKGSEENADDANTASTEIKTGAKYLFHTVQPGDTLWSIAKRYDGVTVEMIKEINNLSSKSTIKIGTKIKVPNSNG